MSPFTCNFTQDILSKILFNNKQVDVWFNALSSYLPKFDVTSKLRLSSFLAQTMTETSNFTILSENLNYSGSTLFKLFPSKFASLDVANQYAYQPGKIANLIYSNRLGNGPAETGDGWKYRGRGLIQLTFRDNYEAFSQDIFGNTSVIDNPDLLLQPDIAVQGALWYWHTHSLNKYADIKDNVSITKLINGGTNGLSQRLTNYNKCMMFL